MVYCYSATQKTAVFAQILARLVNSAGVYTLETDLDAKRAFNFIVRSLFAALFRKPVPVLNMPATFPEEIYVCTPVWGGFPAAPIRYFLQHAPLKNTRVHLLLTCDSVRGLEDYRRHGLAMLDAAGCVAGHCHVMVANGEANQLDTEIIEEHMGILLAGGDGHGA